MYPIIEVAEDAPEATEPLGTKRKFWYQGGQFLFKQVRHGTGEDWAEKVCAELAGRLGLPHAEYDLAVWKTIDGNLRGVRTRNFAPPDAALILGNELLAEADPDYAAVAVAKYRVPAHTVERVFRNLRNRVPALPLGWNAPPFVRNAVDTFIGYLLLDALVGNTDRHHENWAVIRLPEGVVHLAPTFDHASSLGRNLLDEERAERLRTKDRNRTVEAFASRAASALYRTETDRKPHSPLGAFLEAAHFNHAAALAWLDVLDALTEEETAIIINDVPPERISETAAQFAHRIISINKDNLLALKKGLQ
jgi:hypothetical protein